MQSSALALLLLFLGLHELERVTCAGHEVGVEACAMGRMGGVYAEVMYPLPMGAPAQA